jgi:hypothetical protein
MEMSETTWIAHSRCECQASLRSELDGDRHVVRGSAFLRGRRELAPSHTIGATKPDGTPSDRFDLHWACPFCQRNVLRTFTAGGLQRARPAA